MKTNIKFASLLMMLTISIGCISVPRISSTDTQTMSDAELVLKYRELKQKAQEIKSTAENTVSQQSYRSDGASQIGHGIGQLLILASLKSKAEKLKESAENIKAECAQRGIDPDNYP